LEQRAPEVAPLLPKFTLAGTATIPDKRAILKIQVAIGPGARMHEQSLMLREGEREGELEVLNIDAQSGTVNICWSGRPITVKFD
jgi:hypothetical protein